MKAWQVVILVGVVMMLAVGFVLYGAQSSKATIEQHTFVPVTEAGFQESLDTCHALKLSLHSVTVEPVCLKPHDDGKCDLYGMKTEIRCGDSRIKDLHDTTVTNITQAAD